MDDVIERVGDTTPRPRRNPACAVAILDGRLEFARLLEVLVRERAPGGVVRTFTDVDEAERWVGAVDAPVVVLADAEAARGAMVDRAATWSSRTGRVGVVVMAGPDGLDGCPHTVISKPAHLDALRVALDRVLGTADAWHTASPWRTPPAPPA